MIRRLLTLVVVLRKPPKFLMLFHFDDDWNLYCTYLSPDGPQHLDLGCPVHGCKTRIVDPDSKTVHREGEHELQVHSTIVFIHCYNDVEATSCSFVVGTAASVIAEEALCRLESITHCFSTAVPDCSPEQGIEGLVIFTLELSTSMEERFLHRAVCHACALRDISVKMITLPQFHRSHQVEMTTRSRVRLVSLFKQEFLIMYASHQSQARRRITLQFV
ncbi:hypothetical protein F4604DRAFT_486399 [Suillus subluteus]|nr:hypothetical protein F4604DRAFT_486399 [Suillus subluteus]